MCLRECIHGYGFTTAPARSRPACIANANDGFDARFWRRRVEYAVRYRQTVMPGADFACCRLIHSEADQMPGLTVDRYGSLLSVQVASLGMELVKDTVYDALLNVLAEMGETITGIYERNDIAARTLEGLPEYKAGTVWMAGLFLSLLWWKSVKTVYAIWWMWKMGKRPAFPGSEV